MTDPDKIEEIRLRWMLQSNENRTEAGDWLKEYYPKFEDPMAHWDDK